MSRAPRHRTAPAEATPTPATHPDAERCEACGGTRVTRLSMTLTDGTLVDFTSCHTCEHKAWGRNGDQLDLTTVLSKATKPRG